MSDNKILFSSYPQGYEYIGDMLVELNAGGSKGNFMGGFMSSTLNSGEAGMRDRLMEGFIIQMLNM